MRNVHKSRTRSLLILTSCTYSDYTPYTDSEENASDHASRAVERRREEGPEGGGLRALHSGSRNKNAAQKWGII